MCCAGLMGGVKSFQVGGHDLLASIEEADRGEVVLAE